MPSRSRTLALALALAVVGGCSSDAATPAQDAVRIAAGPDAESALLAATALVLLEDAGIAATLVPFSDARDSRRALELGDVDVRIGYSGEAWLEVLGRADPPSDPGRSVDEVRAFDLERGIVWLAPMADDERPDVPANATFAFVVAGPPSIDADLRTLSQLAVRLAERPEATVCVDREFGERPDGLPAVLSTYSVRSDRPFLAADPEEAVLGVVAGDCLAGLTTATDGRAWRAGLQPLVDDLGVFPAFVPLPQVRVEVLERSPAIGRALRPLVAGLTSAELGRANGRVAAGSAVEVVAGELARRLRESLGAG